MSKSSSPRRASVVVAVSALLVAMLVPSAAIADTQRVCAGALQGQFLDTRQSTFASAIDCLASYGIVRGTGGGYYSPSNPVTRQQMAVFVVNYLEVAAGRPLPAPTRDLFSDLGKISSAGTREAINKLALAGIVSGYPDGTYRPARTVTRGQMARYIAGALEAAGVPPGSAGGTNRFSDIATSIFRTDINRIAALGIVVGYPDGTYRPATSVSRGQMASYIVNSAGVTDDAGAWFAPPLTSNQTITLLPRQARSLSSVAYAPANPATYVEYTAAVPSGISSVAIALADPAKVTLSGAGVVSFAPASGSPTRADLANARIGGLRIHAVNGVAVPGGPATAVASARVVERRVSFRLAVSNSNAIGDAVPVVYVPTAGNLLTRANGEPSGHVGVAGALRAIPAQAAVSPTASSTTVWSIDGTSFVGSDTAQSGRLFHRRSGDIHQIGGVGGATNSDVAAFTGAVSVGDTVAVTYRQQLGASGAFVANTFNLVDDVTAAPTNLVASARDADNNGSVDTVRLTFNAGRTGLQTASGARISRYTVTNGVVGSVATQVTRTWAYSGGTSGVVELSGVDFPGAGTYVYTLELRGVVGTSFSAPSAPSNQLTLTSTGLASVASAPIAVSSQVVTDAAPTGTLGAGDVLRFTFNEPVKLAGSNVAKALEVWDAQGDRVRLKTSAGANATFEVSGADSNVLTITVTAAPEVLANPGGNGVQYNAATTRMEATGILDRVNDAPWVAQNAFGPAGTAPVGVSTIGGSPTPAVPFTLTAAADATGSTGTITFDPVTDTLTGTAGAAVPGVTVFVAAVAGTGGSAADAQAATRRQTTAAANGSFTLTLSSATRATTVTLQQELQRTATLRLTSAASAAIVPAPITVLTTSALGNSGTAGTMESGDTIVLRFSAGVDASTIGTAFNVVVSNATPNVITIYKGATGDQVVIATITLADGTRYNTGTGPIAYTASAGAWGEANTQLTIALGTQILGSGALATGVAEHGSGIVAGAGLVDRDGVAISSASVAATASRF